ncbi:unnamed protein product [Allacma fusca]|uniref:procollagen-proline 4-dioxygenase n=1 Tax=Allacma fusca TaxID=39272 RepID=A0A8J2KKV3_9HEXA|nr:unnamed protein product [Allacma fusca]
MSVHYGRKCQVWEVQRTTFLVLVYLLPLLTSATDDYYTSLVGLQKLARVEQQIVSAISEYVTNLERRLQLAKRYLNDYEKSVLPAMSAEEGPSETEQPVTKLTVYNNEKDLNKLAEKVSSHPLMTYRLIRRYAKELLDFEKDLRKDHDKQFSRVMEKIRKGLVLPKVNDVNGAIEGLLRIQDAYDVDIAHFSKGSFNGLRTNSGLLAIDCYHVGLYSLKSHVYTRAIEWLEQAYLMTTEDNDTSIDSQTVHEALQEAVRQHNAAIHQTVRNPYVYRAAVNRNLTDRGSRVRVLATKQYKLYMKDSSMMDFTNFAALCNGTHLRVPSATKDLKCWYETKSPHFLLDPLKVEMHHRNPPVLQIYEVLPDWMISRILAKASPSMVRSKVQGTLENKEIASAVRTSTTTWLPESEDKILKRIPQRVELLTGLKVTEPGSAEDLQISSYGIGGHYNPHFDTLFDTATMSSVSKEEVLMGDRIATFMFYLSDVERGGGTAFPRLGVVTSPIKGSAIFWYNMMSDGKPDLLSLHGGCPVLYGNKWVANKWIRSNAQMFTRPCSLDRD